MDLDDGYDSAPVEYSRSASSRRPYDDRRRAAARGGDRARAPERRPSARPARDDYDYDEEPRGRRPTPERGGGLRGIVAALGIFFVTLAGAGVDSYVGIGLGLITLGSLVGSTVIAALAVRRRDLASVVVAPPLVFVAVAGLNIALAPSATFNAATVATLLIRGFPTMAIATGAAIVLALIRLAARR
jgi:hypothetical protein